MKNLQTDLALQLQSLFEQLKEAEDQEGDLSTRLGSCIHLCVDCLRQLRQSIAAHGFPDRPTEIHFFKHIKPVIVARCLYYQGVIQLHLDEWKGCWTKEKERLSRELEAMAQVFERNKLLWQYYRSGSKALDEQYFLRGLQDWHHQSITTSFDDLFSTGCDGQLAELLAMEQLTQYVDQRLRDAGDPASSPRPRKTPGAIRCTATASEIIELGYALYLAGFFDNGKASVKAVMEHLQEIWQVDLSYYHQTLRKLTDRKHPARFLTRLLELFRRYLDDKDD